MASDSDELKKRLKIENMDKKDRKELFEKFIEKGVKLLRISITKMRMMF